MYERFFNLNTKPFELVPNPDFLFLSKSHRKSMTYLEYGIRERAGFILLTGEVGSGKTTLVRNLVKKLERNTVLSKVFNTMVTSSQLISMINEDFGLPVAGKDKVTLVRELNDFLIDCYSKNRQAILIIDEAQNLSPELLEEVRMLSNLEADRSKLLQIILSGQPELWKKLGSPDLRQLRQRISICCNIYPLTREETEEYILFRLEVAGNRLAVTFEEGTVEAIHEFSRGIPRLINIIADYIMLAAFVDSTRSISMDIVDEVRGELEKENRYWNDETGPQEEGDSFKDLAGRLEKLERELVSRSVSDDGRAELKERIVNIEKLLKQFCNYVIDKKSYT
ncbi:MAG TPA: XrtA/PEP-CTERM system-associated ATPase [Thermodesulfobacteriota bacterium]